MKKINIITPLAVFSIVVIECMLIYFSIHQFYRSGDDDCVTERNEKNPSLSTSPSSELFFCIFSHSILSQ